MRRTVGQLIDDVEDAWPSILEWISSAASQVTVEPSVDAIGEATLFALQVTTRSPMGAIALRSAGITVDHGWVRILGAGGGRFGDGLREWNALDGRAAIDPPLSGAVVIAHDALGGFFVLNSGAWPGEVGRVQFLAPDTYQRQELAFGYSGFLRFVLSDRLAAFYEELRWPGWEREVSALEPDQVLSVWPPLGFESTPLAERSRRPVPTREAWSWFWDIGGQLRDLPDGSAVTFEVRG